jgi:hypothetical protein
LAERLAYSKATTEEQNTEERKYSSVHSAGFEPAIPFLERFNIIRASDGPTILYIAIYGIERNEYSPFFLPHPFCVFIIITVFCNTLSIYLEQNIPRGRIQMSETFSLTMKLKALYKSSYKDVMSYEFKVKHEKI